MTTFLFTSENGIVYKVEISEYIVWAFEINGHGWMAYWKANNKTKVPLDWDFWNEHRIDRPPNDLKRHIDKYIKNMVFA